MSTTDQKITEEDILDLAKEALKWLSVYWPRKGILGWLIRIIIPTACRENLEEVMDKINNKSG